jgi:hypothetical protein
LGVNQTRLPGFTDNDISWMKVGVVDSLVMDVFDIGPKDLCLFIRPTFQLNTRNLLCNQKEELAFLISFEHRDGRGDCFAFQPMQIPPFSFSSSGEEKVANTVFRSDKPAEF